MLGHAHHHCLLRGMKLPPFRDRSGRDTERDF